MIASATTDVALLILAIAVFILTCSAAWRARRVDVSVGNITGSVDFVAEQMTPNGGSSLRDAVDRIEEKVDAHGDRLSDLEEVVTKPSVEIAQLRRHVEQLLRHDAERDIEGKRYGSTSGE
jgi:uncharacterized protein (DUF2164 family)